MLICTDDPVLFVVKVISPRRAFRLSSSAWVRLVRKSVLIASVWLMGYGRLYALYPEMEIVALLE